MEVRHEARFIANDLLQPLVDFHAVERGQAEAGQGGDVFQYTLDQPAEGRAAGKVGAVAGDVHARQNDLPMALVDQCLDLVDDEPGRDRAAVSASVGDDAEGAAMVAARSEEHTSELQSLMRISYAVFC